MSWRWKLDGVPRTCTSAPGGGGGRVHVAVQLRVAAGAGHMSGPRLAAVHVLLLEAALAAALPPPLPHEVLHPGARPGPIRGEYCGHVTSCPPITAHLASTTCPQWRGEESGSFLNLLTSSTHALQISPRRASRSWKHLRKWSSYLALEVNLQQNTEDERVGYNELSDQTL